MLGSSILTQALRKVTPHNLLGRKTLQIEDQFSNETFEITALKSEKVQIRRIRPRFHWPHLINLYGLLRSIVQ